MQSLQAPITDSNAQADRIIDLAQQERDEKLANARR